jgi:hypothetical protein
MALRLWTAVPHRPLHDGIWRDPTETRAEYVTQIVMGKYDTPAFSRVFRHAPLTVRIGLPGLRGLGKTNSLSEPCSFFHSLRTSQANRLNGKG